MKSAGVTSGLMLFSLLNVLNISNVGISSEPLPNLNGRMTRQYFGGILRALEAIRPLLAPGAHIVLVVGESAHAGVLVPVPDLIAELGELAGYKRASVRTLRTRRSSSHKIGLKESAVVLRIS